MKPKGKRLFVLILILALTVTSVSVPPVTAEAAKTVKVKKVQITSPKKKSVTLKKGKTLQLKVKVTPKNAKNKKVKYGTSNKKVVKVTSKGKIKALKNGTARITVTARDGSKKKAVLKVKVVTPVSKVKLNAVSSTLTVGKTAALKATVSPASASKKTLKWTTSNKSVATVTSKGVVKAVKAGTAVITATATDGSKKKATCKVTVQAESVTPKPPVAQAVLDSIAITGKPDKTGYLEGEKFDPAGMEVTAFYSDGSKKILKSDAYTYEPKQDLAIGDKKVIVTYQEQGRIRTAEIEIVVLDKTTVVLERIEITKQPDKMRYLEGEKFDPAGMEVTAVYSDGDKKILEAGAYSYEPDRALAVSDKLVTVTYQELGRPKTAEVKITVVDRNTKVLDSIKITKQPDKTDYLEGELFDSAGMEVTAVYSDASETVLGENAYTFEPDRGLAITDEAVFVTYQEQGRTQTAEVAISVLEKTSRALESITIAKQPGKTVYLEGEKFDPAGMKVTASYSDGHKKVLADDAYTYEPKRELAIKDKSVTITYQELGRTQTAEVAITVLDKTTVVLDSIEITAQPDKKAYYEGEKFDPAGMEVTAVYTDGSRKVLAVDAYTYEPGRALTIKDKSVTVTYQEQGRTQTAEIQITVLEKPKVLKSIEITRQPDKMVYLVGETFDPAGMKLNAVYEDGITLELDGDSCSFEPSGPLTVNDNEITVTYQDGDVSFTKKISISVRKIALQKIEVTTMPSKTEYKEGDNFDPTGMVVKASYTDNTSKEVTGYTYSEAPLDPADQVVEIAYTEDGVTKKTAIDIVVEAENQLDHITYRFKSQEKEPALEIAGTVFREEDIEITAHLENGTTRPVSITKCQVRPSAFTLDTTSATVSYVYGTRRKSCEVTGFTVKPYRERYGFEDKESVGTIVKRADETADAVPTEDSVTDENYNNLEFVQGLSGNALKMDGTYGLRLDKLVNTDSQSYSISMWVKPDSGYKENMALFISTANEFWEGGAHNWCAVAGTNNTGGLKLWSRGSSGLDLYQAVTTNISVGQDAEWSHIVLVVDGTEGSKKAVGTLYVNGRKVGSGDVQNEKGPNMKTYLGVTAWKNDGYYSGLVDELVFANEAFTPEDVEGYYLEQYADKLTKITAVTADDGIEVEYGTSLADIKRALAEQVTIIGGAGTETLNLPNSADIWTVDHYTVTTKGKVNASGKTEAPVDYVFDLGNGRFSIWKQVPVAVNIKEPVLIEQITPSKTQITVPYGTTEAKIREQLAELTFTVKTADNSPYSLRNGGSLWNLTKTDTGYSAVAALPRADVGYEYAEGKIGYQYADGKAAVTIPITVSEPITINSIKADKEEITVPYNSSVSDVQGELADLKLTAEVSGGEAPVLKNQASIWNIAEYNPEEAKEYTAEAKIAAPLGYKFAEGAADTITVKVTVSAKSEEKNLVNIAISTLPSRTKYIEGHTFDKTGMVVEAVYSNGEREVVTEQAVVDKTGPLTAADTSVTVSYTETGDAEGGVPVTKSKVINISVVDLKNGAVGYYGFDGNLNDKQAEGKTAKLVNNGGDLTDNAALTADYVSGVKGEGILLNDTTAKTALELASKMPSGKYDFTINMWVKPKSLSQGWAMILSSTGAANNKELVLYANPDGTAASTINVQNGHDPYVNIPNLLSENQWVMLTWVNAENEMKLFVNGKDAYTGVVAKDGISRLFLGGGHWDPFHGVFDEVSIYDCTLTKDEVAELYHHVPWTVSEVTYEKTIEVTKSNASEEAVKAQLSKLPLKAAIEYGEEAPVLESAAADQWTLTGTAEEGYTASATLVLPEGYVWKDGTRNVPLEVKVTVRPGELKEITFTPPEKTDYIVDELFDRTGMKVEAVYEENGAVLDETSDVTNLVLLSDGTSWKETDPLTEGNKTITVSYADKTAAFTITVQTMEDARTAYYTFDDKLDNEKAADKPAKMVKKAADTGAQNLIDSSVSAEYAEGIDGKGIWLNKDGKDNMILELGSAIPSGKKDFAINMWVQPKAVNLDYRLMLFGGDVSANIGLGLYAPRAGQPAGSITVVNGDDTKNANFTEQLSVDKWTMITWVNSGNKMELYVDGTKVGDGPSAENHPVTRLFLGGSWWGDYFRAVYDEVSVYERSLNAKQVKYLYDKVPSIISGVSASETELMFLQKDIQSDPSKIQKALSELDINVTMKHGEKCEFKNDENWILSPALNGAGTYTASKTWDLPDGYVVNGKETERTVIVNVTINVKDASLTSIRIEKQPNKRAYLVGDVFDKTGMEITAVYTKSDNSTEEQDVTSKAVILNADQQLQAADKSVTVSYTEGGTTKTAEAAIDVYTAEQPESIYAARTAYYTFDNTLANEQIAGKTAKIVNKIGYKNFTDGEIFESAYNDNGVKGKGIHLNDSQNLNKLVELDATMPKGKYDFAINLWVQPKSLSQTWGMILSSTGESDKELVLYSHPNTSTENAISIQNGESDVVVPGLLFADQWIMLTWVNSQNEMKLYVNGEKAYTGTVAKNGISKLLLGGGNWDPFHGVYDEVSVFDRTLKATEVEYLYRTVPWTISDITYENTLNVLSGDTEESIKEKLSKLLLNVTMENGKAPEFENKPEDWTLVGKEGGYTATKKLVLADPYQMADGKKEYTLTVDVTVKEASLTGITVKEQPVKTAFLTGDTFHKSDFVDSGMVVEASYSDESTQIVTDEVTVSNDGQDLAHGTDKITVTYTEGGETFTAEVNINVYADLTTVPASMYARRVTYYTFDNDSLKNAYTKNNAVFVNAGVGFPVNTGQPVFEDGISGKGISLNKDNATGQALDLENKIPDLPADFTVNFWVKPGKINEGVLAWCGGTQTDDNRGFTIYDSNDSNNSSKVKIYMNGHNNKGLFEAGLGIGEWTMLTWVNKSSGSVELYSNGNLITTINEGVTVSKEKLLLGGCPWGNSCSAVFDEASLFNMALSADQVKALYDANASSN